MRAVQYSTVLRAPCMYGLLHTKCMRLHTFCMGPHTFSRVGGVGGRVILARARGFSMDVVNLRYTRPMMARGAWRRGAGAERGGPRERPLGAGRQEEEEEEEEEARR